MNDIKLAVLGSEGVGKSALIVRFQTRRFIGGYASLTVHLGLSLINVQSQCPVSSFDKGKMVWANQWQQASSEPPKRARTTPTPTTSTTAPAGPKRMKLAGAPAGSVSRALQPPSVSSWWTRSEGQSLREHICVLREDAVYIPDMMT
ncbi:unnamed protein product [Arctogadus glacialis]